MNIPIEHILDFLQDEHLSNPIRIKNEKDPNNWKISINDPFISDTKLRLGIAPKEIKGNMTVVFNGFKSSANLGDEYFGDFYNFVRLVKNFDTRKEAKNYFISKYILQGKIDLNEYLKKYEEEKISQKEPIKWYDSFERFDINREDHKPHLDFMIKERNIELHRIKNIKIFIDNYTDRIVFPVYEDNELIFYTKRSIVPTMYNWIKAKADDVYPIWNIDNIYSECYIFEGIFDAIHLKNGIALLGANLNESIKKLGSKKCKIYNIIMDNDEAGLKAKIKIANILTNDFNAKVNIYNYKGIDCKDFGEMKIKGINFQLKERLMPYDFKTQLLLKKGYII